MRILPKKERRGSVLPVSLAVLALALEPVVTPIVFADPAPKGPSGGVSQSAPTSTLYGIIRSSKDGKPMSGVPITITNRKTGASIQVQTSSQGGYIFTSLPAGDYIINAGGEKFSQERKEGLLKEGTVGEIDFTLTPLSAGLSDIVGMVYRQQGNTQEPVSVGIKIKNVKTGEIYTVHSNSKGQYALNEIPPGKYFMQVNKRGFSPVTMTLDVTGKTRQDIALEINRMAEAEISAEGNKKIRDNTGAISIVSQKKFQQNLNTGAAYTLMQNTPGIEYYSRSGSEGITGGMNYMSCRGYTVGGANTNPQGTSGIEMSVDGVPLNNEADGGEIYDLGIMNTDIKSAEVQRGVTTSRETGSYAAGCSINFKTVEPTQDAYQKVTAGGGSYGLYYTSYINNSGISDNGWGGYNDFTILHQDGFQEFTPLTEYQYYGNLTKYLNNGKIYFLGTANYKTYDRGASMTVANYNAFGPTFNGGPSFGNTNNVGSTPNSPFYKQWNYGRFMLDLGLKDQITPSIRVKNSLYVVAEPYGDTSMPAGFGSCTASTGTCTTNQFTAGSTFQSINPNMSGQLGYMFLQNYYQAEGYKAGDIAELKFLLFPHDNLYLGMKGQYATYHYYTNPMFSNNIVGGTIDAWYSQTSIVGYLEDHYRPVKQVLVSAGFRVASIAQFFNDQVPSSEWSLYNSSGPGGTYGGGGGVGVSNGGSMLVPLPHLGINVYPTDDWKIYVTGGESFAPPAIFDYKGFAPGTTPGSVNPEYVWDLSAGVRYGTERGFLAGDVFADYISNMPVPVTFSNAAGTNYTQFENIGSAREQGVELEGQLKIGYGFSGSANFTVLNGIYGNTPLGAVAGNINAGGNLQGEQIAFIPQSMGNVALSYDHGPYHLTIDERFTGQMNVIDTSNAYQIDSPAYWVTDLYATYDLPTVKGWYKSSQIFVSAYNLFNTNYYNPSGVTGYNSVETLFVYPGEPVNVFAGLDFTF